MFNAHKCYVVDTKPTLIQNTPQYQRLLNRVMASSMHHAKLEEVYQNLANGGPAQEKRLYLPEFSVPLRKNLFGLYLINVSINDIDKSFLLDTGAQVSAITEKCARECDCESSEGVMQIESFAGSAKQLEATIVKKVRVGALELVNQPMVLSSLQDISPTLFGISLTGIEGILGWDILSQLDFEIDDLHRTFNVIKYNDEVTSCNMISGMFPTLVVVNGQKEYALAGFDSGAKSSWISERLIDDDKIKKVNDGEALVLGVHGLETTHLSIVNEVRFKFYQSNLVFENIITGRTNIFKDLEFDAVFGNEIIRKRKIRFVNSQNFAQIL